MNSRPGQELLNEYLAPYRIPDERHPGRQRYRVVHHVVVEQALARSLAIRLHEHGERRILRDHRRGIRVVQLEPRSWKAVVAPDLLRERLVECHSVRERRCVGVRDPQKIEHRRDLSFTRVSAASLGDVEHDVDLVAEVMESFVGDVVGLDIDAVVATRDHGLMDRLDRGGFVELRLRLGIDIHPGAEVAHVIGEGNAHDATVTQNSLSCRPTRSAVRAVHA